MNDWKPYKLGEILSDKGYIRGPFGSALRRPELKARGVPVYEQQNAISNHRDFRFFVDDKKFNELKRFQVKTDDLIISCSGTLGKVSIIAPNDPKGIISQALLALRPNTRIVLPKFLYYFLSAPIGFNQLIDASHGSVQVNIAKRSVVESIPLSLPSIETQEKIVSILSSFDDKIELNRRMNATLEAMARALFKAWFVDFEPVHANRENRPSTSASPEIAKLFPSDFENGIPKGWTIGKVGDVCEVNKGTLNKSDHFEFLKYVEISEVSKGVINNVSIYERGAEPSRAKRKLSHGDVVISTVRPDRGAYFLAFRPEENLIASTGFAVFSPDSVPFSFLYLFLTDVEQLTFYGKRADGAAYPAINQSVISEMESVVPTDEILKQFHSFAEPMFSKMANNLSESRSLGEIRDSLLPRLISGKLRVGE